MGALLGSCEFAGGHCALPSIANDSQWRRPALCGKGGRLRDDRNAFKINPDTCVSVRVRNALVDI